MEILGKHRVLWLLSSEVTLSLTPSGLIRGHGTSGSSLANGFSERSRNIKIVGKRSILCQNARYPYLPLFSDCIDLP